MLPSLSPLSLAKLNPLPQLFHRFCSRKPHFSRSWNKFGQAQPRTSAIDTAAPFAVGGGGSGTHALSSFHCLPCSSQRFRITVARYFLGVCTDPRTAIRSQASLTVSRSRRHPTQATCQISSLESGRRSRANRFATSTTCPKNSSSSINPSIELSGWVMLGDVMFCLVWLGLVRLGIRGIPPTIS